MEARPGVPKVVRAKVPPSVRGSAPPAASLNPNHLERIGSVAVLAREDIEEAEKYFSLTSGPTSMEREPPVFGVREDIQYEGMRVAVAEFEPERRLAPIAPSEPSTANLLLNGNTKARELKVSRIVSGGWRAGKGDGYRQEHSSMKRDRRADANGDGLIVRPGRPS